MTPDADAARRGPAAALSGAWGRTAVAFLLYSVLAALAFLPLLLKLGSAALFEPGDLTSTARDYWAAEQLGETPFTLEHDDLLFAPEGQARAPAAQIANAVQPAFALLLEPVLGYLGALNLYMLLGFALSGAVMFTLLDRLRFHVIASFVGGAVYSFNWWQFEQAYYGHIGLNHIWVFPLLVLAFLRLRRRQDFLTGLLAGAVLGLSFYAFTYLGLVAAGLALTFMAVDLLDRRRDSVRRALFAYGVAWTTLLACLFPALAAAFLVPSGLDTSFPTPKEFFFGARLEDYFIPSSHHPVLGGVSTWLNDDLPHVGEAVVFFGWTVLALAFAALLGWRRFASDRTASPDRRTTLRVAAVLVPVGFLMSLPAYATVAGVRIPLPDAAFVVGSFLNWWKIYSRFGILLGLAVAVLAAFVLHLFLRHHGAAIVVPVLGAFIAFEAYPHVGEHVVDLEPTPVVEWLTRQPAGIVAHYPMLIEWRGYGVEGWGAYAWRTVYDQSQHGHALYAVPSLRPEGTRREAVRLMSTDIQRPLTARVLSAQDVRYVVIHDDMYEALGRRSPDTPPGLALRARFEQTRVYEVKASPTPNLERLLFLYADEIRDARGIGSARVRFTGGVHPTEPYQGLRGRWMNQGATLEVETGNPGYPTKWSLVVRAFSNAVPRRLHLVGDDGGVLGSIVVQPFESVQVVGDFKTRPDGTTLTLRADPGPAPLGGRDPRSASIFIAEAWVRPVPY